MPIIKNKCPQCNKPAETVAEKLIAGIRINQYPCGHIEAVHQLEVRDFANFVSSDGHRPRKFQIEGALFGINGNARVLIADDMGLGKTVQACMIMATHPSELTKFLVLCKAGLKAQWTKEVARWCGSDWLPQVVSTEQDYLVPGVKGFVLSFDTLWRFKDIESWMQKARIKFIILDEVQHIKNSDSKRTNGVRLASRQVKHIVGLSGTPIKNHAGEYFTVLNLIRPDLFRTKATFDQVWVDTYWSGRTLKYGGLKDQKSFERYTKDFIIRRTREEVMPELPTVTRDFRFSELGPAVEKAYIDTFKQFQNYMNYDSIGVSAIEKQANILSYLSKMRHLTGIAKIEPVIDYTEDFIESTSRKLVIFAHHKDVGAALLERLSALCAANPEKWGSGVLNIQGISPDNRAPIIEQFALPGYRILIAGELASSEGLNLQFCDACVLMERQWNPANEEQAEARFIRIGQVSNKVTAMYPIAIGTIDEFLTELIEKKRQFMLNTLDGKEIQWNQSSIIQELAEILNQTGGKKWSI